MQTRTGECVDWMRFGRSKASAYVGYCLCVGDGTAEVAVCELVAVDESERVR